MKQHSVLFVIVLASSLLFSLSSCNGGKKTTESRAEKGLIITEIVAKLKGKVKPQTVVVAYQRYQLETIKVISKETNTWLFTFDNSLIEAKEMLFIMENSQFVSTAKYNRKE